MDHKVSKDMISSGMTPSGEKTQADLGRTQYGSAPSPSKLMDAYKSMYEHHKKDADGNTIPHEGEEVNEVVGMMVAQSMKKAANPKKKTTTPQLSAEGKIPAGLQAYLDKKKGKKEDKKEVKEEADLFDVISTHFINEGYEEKDVYKAMASLTEDQLQNLDEAIPLIGGALAALGKVAAGVGTKVAAAGGLKTIGAKGLASAGKLATSVAKNPMGALKSAGKGVMSAGKNVAKTVKSNVSSGLNKPFNTNVVQGPKPAPMQGPRQANFGDKLKNVGRGVKDFYQSKDVGMANKILATTTAMDVAGRFGGAMRPRGLQKSDTDLFDIVKGQLLDEGLSEEEIKDIMLTLTPDEIMEELSDTVKRNDAINKANAMKAAQERREKSTPPKEVTDAAKRQYKAGSPGAEPYTTSDKKTIQNYYKNK